MFLISALITFIAIPLATESSPVSDVNTFWRKTGIDLRFVRPFISNGTCHRDAAHLQGCMQAIKEARLNVGARPVKWNGDFDKFLEQLNALSDLKISRQLLYGKMISAQLRSFDAHAFLAPVEALESFLGPQSSATFSIGISTVKSRDVVRVGIVVPSSAAEFADIRSFDRVIAINGVEAKDDVVKVRETMAQTLPGGVQTLVLERNGETITRQVRVVRLTPENVSVSKVNIQGDDFAFVRILQFRSQMCSDVRKKIAGLSGTIKGLVLDLRFNPGGRVDEAVCLSGLFLSKKPIVGEKAVDIHLPIEVASFLSQDREIHWQFSADQALFPSLPVIVLVNQLSASASEIVAGALQDHQRAWVVGERTFGKGSVQTIRPYPANLLFQIGYTSALFYRPMQTTNQLVGVTPNFIVPFSPTASLEERMVLREQDVPGAIHSSEQVPPWLESRKNEQAVLSLCAHARPQASDYQKDYAFAVLRCMLHQTILVRDQRPESKSHEYTNI